MKRFYLPISAFVFPEVAGSEAIFPTDGDVTGVFIGRSTYPTVTTGVIPVNPTGNVLILYSAPVTWTYHDGPSMDYPLVIEVPEEWVDKKALTELKLASLPDGITAWAYSRTIFFGHDAAMRYLFRTEAEKKQRIDSLLSFTEIKDLGYLETVCSSFEKAALPVVNLPDTLGDDIRLAVSSLEVDPSWREEDLCKETRCGACLGHVIAGVSTTPIRLDDALNRLPAGELAKTREIVEGVTGKFKQLEEILSDSMGVEHTILPISVRSIFKFKGRDCLQLWSRLDSRIQECVEFIARYPRNDWNWYGDEERFIFMRELWNQVLQPSLSTSSQEVVDTLRAEMSLICRHFKNPNSVEFSLDTVRSSLLQAFCIALDCPRGSEKLKECLKEARRPDYCLTIFGALRGYAYFSRELFPNYCRYVTPTPKPEPKPIIDEPPDTPIERPTWASRIFYMLKNILTACKIKSKKKVKELQESFCQAAQECGSEDKLLGALSKKKGWGKRTSVYKKLAEMMTMDGKEGDLFEHMQNTLLCSDQGEQGCNENDGSKVSEQEPSPAKSETASRKLTSLIEYDEWLAECRSLVKSEKAAEIFSKDVAWFVEHRELHPEPQYVDSVRDKSNSAVLKRFVDYLEKQSRSTNPNQKWKLDFYKEIPIPEIEAKLREIYGC